MIVILKNVRLIFADLHEARQFQGTGDFTYNATVVIDPVKQADQIKLMESTILKAAQEVWKNKAEATLKALKAADKLCIHDGNAKAEDEKFEGMFYVSARNKVKPKVVDHDPNKDLTAADGRPYRGCYVNIKLDVWAQDNGFGKRINAKLIAVQFNADGDAYAGAPPTVDGFDDISDFGGEETTGLLE